MKYTAPEMNVVKFEAEEEVFVFTGKTWGWKVPLS